MADQEYEVHPLAETWPPLSTSEFEDLKASIQAVGVRHPIMLYEGKILDGRNRYRAAKEVALPSRQRPTPATIRKPSSWRCTGRNLKPMQHEGSIITWESLYC